MSDTKSSALSVLQRAREILATKGWIRGALAKFGEDGPDGGMHHCALGAILRAEELPMEEGWIYQRASTEEATRVLSGAILTHVKNAHPEHPLIYHGELEPTNIVVYYNDSPGRTSDEMLTVFDEAIASLTPAPFVALPEEEEEVAHERTRTRRI